MKILGIDPGYGIVGWGVVDIEKGNVSIVDYGTIETPKDMRMTERLKIIGESFEKLMDIFKPDAVSIEELFFFRNYTTVIPVAEARGIIINACYKTCKEIYEYTPLQIKQALTGNGRAEKKQVQYMVKNILGLSEIPKPDDAADAVAVAICHSQINSVLNDNLV